MIKHDDDVPYWKVSLAFLCLLFLFWNVLSTPRDHGDKDRDEL